jgi:hypothetical protein
MGFVMETQDNFAPYPPIENVLRVLSKARSGGIRGPIDTNFLIQLGINDSMAPRTIRALGFLGFIDGNGKATPLFEKYVQASDEEAATVLRQALEQAYAAIFRAVDPVTDSRQKVFNAFRTMKPQGQWDRMVTLFLGLCKEAGMDVKDAPSARARASDSPREQRASKSRSSTKEPESVRPASMRWISPSSYDLTEPLDPSLLAFLGKLREIKSAEALDTWYQAFRTLFAYVLSTNPKSDPPPENVEDQVEA